MKEGSRKAVVTLECIPRERRLLRMAAAAEDKTVAAFLRDALNDYCLRMGHDMPFRLGSEMEEGVSDGRGR